MMNHRCEPLPEHRGQDGWHWLAITNSPNECVFWRARTLCWVFGTQNESPLQVASYGYTYLEPTLTPAEAAALRAEVADTNRLLLATQGDLGDEQARTQELLKLPEHVSAQRIWHLQESMRFLANIARSLGFQNRRQETNPELIGRALRELADAKGRGE